MQLTAAVVVTDGSPFFSPASQLGRLGFARSDVNAADKSIRPSVYLPRISLRRPSARLKRGGCRQAPNGGSARRARLGSPPKIKTPATPLVSFMTRFTGMILSPVALQVAQRKPCAPKGPKASGGFPIHRPVSRFSSRAPLLALARQAILCFGWMASPRNGGEGFSPTPCFGASLNLEKSAPIRRAFKRRKST